MINKRNMLLILCVMTLVIPVYGEISHPIDNAVTFNREDATIELPTYPGGDTGITLQFKTTILMGVILQNTGPSHFIEIKLASGNIAQFRYNVGNGIQTLEITTAYALNDDNWHTLHVDRSRKQSRLKLDYEPIATLEEPTDQEFRPLILDSPLIVGATVNFSDGFVGCVRAMQVSGVLMDLKGIVERGEVTYGVLPGCHPKCESNPCYNNGTCIEWYSRFQCNCSNTPFRGIDCGREIGVTMQPDYMIRYEFDRTAGNITTDEENIYIGFSTQVKRGMLMYIRSDRNDEVYMSIGVNFIGGIGVIMDVGWFRDEINTDIPNVDLANGQPHIVHVTRSNNGSTLTIAVDDYTPAIRHWDIPTNARTSLHNLRYIYFGRNESTRPGYGFKGCLFRAQFGNYFPLATAFQEPRGSNIYVEPAESIREDTCGFEEFTRATEPVQSRPNQTTTPRLPNKITSQLLMTSTLRHSVVSGGTSIKDFIVVLAAGVLGIIALHVPLFLVQ